LSLQGIAWAFTNAPSGNWHPLTWLSHMLDIELFGMNPGPHHLVNVFFHIINTLLLFLILNKMTGEIWKSGFVAALFALHPLHVESVAWIAERKDVLSGLFWMLTIWFYLLYIEKPDLKRYFLVALFFILGLMSKPMIVTLPFVLLLLDYWPLKRFTFDSSRDSKPGDKFIPFRFIIEKIPLFVFVLLSSLTTFLAEKQGKAVGSIDVFSFKTRVFNAFFSYIIYLEKTFWPNHLSVFYPYPEIFPLWQVFGALFFLMAVTTCVIIKRKSLPYLSVGWFWYLLTLLPVIGLVQVGSQSMADRYTYLPLIGIFIMISWGIPPLFQSLRYQKIIVFSAGSAFLIFLSIATWFQITIWRNSISLFSNAIYINYNNNIAHNNLGTALAKKGDLADAVSHFREALKGKPDFLDAHFNLGVALAKLGNFQDAGLHLEKALEDKSGVLKIYLKLGSDLIRSGKAADSIPFFKEALKIDPDLPEAHDKLGIAFGQRKEYENAVFHFKKALQLSPGSASIHNHLGITFSFIRKFDEAVFHFKEALKINPGFAEARRNLEKIKIIQQKNR
jgi:tetratricopeptide (TPR) repeat protein